MKGKMSKEEKLNISKRADARKLNLMYGITPQLFKRLQSNIDLGVSKHMIQSLKKYDTERSND
jgi:plasmid maintenance system antidote protein VapI